MGRDPLWREGRQADGLSLAEHASEYDGAAIPDTEYTMRDFTTATGHDSTIVQIAFGNEVRYWCDALGCTEAQLRESVQAVGTSPEDVRDFLKVLSQRGVF